MLSVQAVNFIVMLILARLLAPSDFGLIAMIQIFLSIGQSLVDSGMTSSLLRNKDLESGDYSSVFFFNIIVSAVIYLLLFAVAPLISSFFGQPLLKPIVRVLGVTILIQSFFSIQNTIFTRELKFKIQMILQLPSVIIAGVCGLLFARYGFGVWSIVFMNIIRISLYTIFHWVASSWRPTLEFRVERIKYHITYGYKLTLSGLLNTFFNNIYKLVIGKSISITQLGLYDRAFELRQLPISNLSMALDKVTFPAFAKIQNDLPRLKNAYRSMMLSVLFGVALLMIIFSVNASSIFTLLYGNKWISAAPYFQIMCIGGILFPIHSYNLNILKVKGRSDLFLKLEIIKKIVVLITVVISIRWGIYGLLYGQVLVTVLSFFINSWHSGKLINYPTIEQLKDMTPIFIAAAIALIVAVLCSRFTEGFANSVKIIFNSLVTLLVYIGIVFMLDKNFLKKNWNLVKNISQKRI